MLRTLLTSLLSTQTHPQKALPPASPVGLGARALATYDTAGKYFFLPAFFAHEMSHYAVARCLRYPAQIQFSGFKSHTIISGLREDTAPLSTLLVASAGPLANLTLTGISAGLYFSTENLLLSILAAAFGAPNLIIGIFTLIPAVSPNGVAKETDGMLIKKCLINMFKK